MDSTLPIRTEGAGRTGAQNRAAGRNHSRLPTYDPEPQKGRGRPKDCRCGRPCFYCGEALDEHDHDHFPLPWRHGGRETVPACRRCHSLKERVPLHRWSPAALRAASEGVDQIAAAALAMCNGILAGGSDLPMGQPEEVRNTVLMVVRRCSTAEARIATAKAFAITLDAEGSQ